MKYRQQGMTLLGFVIVLAVVGVFAYVGMKLFPMYSEFYSVKSSLKAMANEPGIAEATPAQIKESFFRRLYINYSENVKDKDIKVSRTDAGWQVDVVYEVRVPMAFNLDVVGKFNASQMMTRGGAGG